MLSVKFILNHLNCNLFALTEMLQNCRLHYHTEGYFSVIRDQCVRVIRFFLMKFNPMAGGLNRWEHWDLWWSGPLEIKQLLISAAHNCRRNFEVICGYINGYISKENTPCYPAYDIVVSDLPAHVMPTKVSNNVSGTYVTELKQNFSFCRRVTLTFLLS